MENLVICESGLCFIRYVFNQSVIVSTLVSL